MDDRVRLFLQETGPVLCVDIGDCLQNAVLAKPGIECENWPRFTFYSPARLVAQRIRELTLLKSGIWLYGSNMGGGFAQAVSEHIAKSLPISATPAAASAIHDNIDYVKQLGVHISEICPVGSVPIYLRDYDPEFWNAILRHAGLPGQHMTLAAVQDHGDHKDGNRQERMLQWQKMIMQVASPLDWVFEKAPDGMSRLKALQAHTGGPVADTATCAILGALCDPIVFERSCREGITIINVGNAHLLAVLVYKGKICGIYEHHTDKQGVKMLLEDLKQFRLHWLPSEKVHADGGHGVVFGEVCAEAGGYEPTFIIGPKREILRNYGMFIAPHGDMLHAGCFGLLYGWSRSHAHV